MASGEVLMALMVRGSPKARKGPDERSLPNGLPPKWRWAALLLLLLLLPLQLLTTSPPLLETAAEPMSCKRGSTPRTFASAVPGAFLSFSKIFFTSVKSMNCTHVISAGLLSPSVPLPPPPCLLPLSTLPPLPPPVPSLACCGCGCLVASAKRGRFLAPYRR